MSNVDINVDRRMDEWTDIRKSGCLSQSQEVREMFHAKFDGCLVLQLIRILTLTLMSNVDINVDRRTDGRTENRTPISHPATSRCDKNTNS